MARKTKSETQKTITGILDAAEVVFRDKGVAQTTMADIAEKAGVSRGAIYGHYRDKVQVCQAMCERSMTATATITEQVPGEAALITLQRWGMNYLRLIHGSCSIRNALEILYVKCEASPEYEPLMKIRLMWEKRFQRATRLLLHKAVVQDELPASADLDLCDIYIQSLLTGLSTTLWWSDRLGDAPWPKVEKLMTVGLESLHTSAHLKKA